MAVRSASTCLETKRLVSLLSPNVGDGLAGVTEGAIVLLPGKAIENRGRRAGYARPEDRRIDHQGRRRTDRPDALASAKARSGRDSGDPVDSYADPGGCTQPRPSPRLGTAAGHRRRWNSRWTPVLEGSELRAGSCRTAEGRPAPVGTRGGDDEAAWKPRGAIRWREWATTGYMALPTPGVRVSERKVPHDRTPCGRSPVVAPRARGGVPGARPGRARGRRPRHCRGRRPGPASGPGLRRRLLARSAIRRPQHEGQKPRLEAITPKRGSTITNSATRQREQNASIADETCIERPRSARAKRGAS